MSRRAVIDAPIDDVWPVLADFAGTFRWNPFVLKSFAVNGRTTGLGARRRCEFDDAGSKWLEEEIISFDESATRYTIRLMEGTERPPLDDVRVEIAAEPVGETATAVAMTAHLDGRSLSRRITARIGGLVLGRVLGKLLASLREHVAELPSPGRSHPTSRA